MKTKKPVLFIFSGLPGSGKTTLAKLLSKHTGATYLRIDTIEQGIRELCSFNVQGEGYRLAYRIAADNLMIGNNVIADSCNPTALTRSEWEKVAIDSGAEFINIEIKCSDKTTHKKRIESRENDIPDLKLPNWEQIQTREFHIWSENRIIIDTAGENEQSSFDCLLYQIEHYKKPNE